MHNTLDVIVIRAGLSGLYSAYQLQQQGLQTVILEARPRLGGRIHGMEIHHLHSLDLVPSWFWPHQVEMQQLCERLNLTIFEQYITGQALYQASSKHPVERFSGAGAMTSYRLKGGLGQLTAALAQRLSAHSAYLNESVQHCRFDKGLWQIRSRSLTLHAKQLIVATPPRDALTTTDISKVLSEPLRQTLLNTPTWMASQAKLVAHYPQPFWRQQGLSGDAFSRVGPLVEIHDASRCFITRMLEAIRCVSCRFNCSAKHT